MLISATKVQFSTVFMLLFGLLSKHDACCILIYNVSSEELCMIQLYVDTCSSFLMDPSL